MERHKQFSSAFASRDTVGQAEGVLMKRFGIDDGAAFNLLKLLSQEWNIPTTEVAQRVVRSRRTDGNALPDKEIS